MPNYELISLSDAMAESLKESAVPLAADALEVALDSIIEEGILKDIPLVSSAVSVYKIGNSIRDSYNIKKLAVFVDEINKGIFNESDRRKHIEKLQKNKKKRDKELEYIMILIDRYTSVRKPQMLAKLYMAYWQGDILWNEFTVYAEAIDRFLCGDDELLCKGDSGKVYRKTANPGYARLVALGLMHEGDLFEEDGMDSVMPVGNTEATYQITPFGQKFVAIIQNTINA